MLSDYSVDVGKESELVLLAHSSRQLSGHLK